MMTCDHCGALNVEGAAACSICGHELEAEAAAAATTPECPECGQPVGDADDFCAGCGYSFGAARRRSLGRALTIAGAVVLLAGIALAYAGWGEPGALLMGCGLALAVSGGAVWIIGKVFS